MAFIPAAESMFRNNEETHFPNPSSSSCAPHDFHGFLMRRSMSFSGMERGVDELQPDDEMSDDGSQMLGEKKRRLNLEQVKALEKSFESGNKLEPDRKIQLARALGLQPRQIAIWFQNRRARWKTKQLEKDYNILKRQFDALKADNDNLKSQNKNLQAQLLGLKGRETTGTLINLNYKDNNDQAGSNWSNGSDENSCDHHVNLNITTTLSSTDNNNNNNSTILFPHHHHLSNNKNAVVFPSTSLTHLLHTSDHPRHLQMSHKINNEPSTSNDQAGTFCTMFGGIEETPEFWPWPEQQNFQ